MTIHAIPARALTSGADHRVVDALRFRADAGRRAIRIVQAGWGSGVALFRAVTQARRLGFVAIEARGFDSSAAAVGLALRTASCWRDPRIGLSFAIADLGQGLEDEAEASVDLFLCARSALGALSPVRRAAILARVRGVADRLILTGEG